MTVPQPFQNQGSQPGVGTVDSAIPGNLVIFCCSAGALL
jgi:hypothetical protein